MNRISSPIRRKGFEVLWEQRKDGILSPTPRVFDETPSNQLLIFLVHFIYIRIFERNHVHISVVLFCFCFTFYISYVYVRLFLEFWVSLQYFRVLGFAVPALVRKDKKEKVGLTASPISEVGPTRLSSRRDISSATSLEKTSMEVDQGEVVGSIGEKRKVGRLLPEKRDLWTSRVGFEPPYCAVLYFESSMSSPLLRHGNATELRSPILLYESIYMPVNC